MSLLLWFTKTVFTAMQYLDECIRENKSAFTSVTLKMHKAPILFGHYPTEKSSFMIIEAWRQGWAQIPWWSSMQIVKVFQTVEYNKIRKEGNASQAQKNPFQAIYYPRCPLGTYLPYFFIFLLKLLFLLKVPSSISPEATASWIASARNLEVGR